MLNRPQTAIRSGDETNMALSESLSRIGWYLSPDGLTQCVEACKEKGLDPTQKNIEKIALDCDLRVIGAQGLPDDIIRNLQHKVQGPIVLQVQKLKNVAVPSTQQQNPSPSRRVLRVQLTDGHIHCSGVEIEGAIDKLSPMTPPGTKLKLLGTVEVQNGFLLMKRSSIQVLGGRVEHLYKKWSLHMALPDNVERGKGGTDGPPPFTPFKKVIGSSEQREIVSHSRSMKETDSHSMKETDSHSRSMKETDSHSRSTKETDSHSRSMKETDSHSREPGNRPLQDAREEKKQVSKRNPSEVKPSRFHDGDGSKPQWKNDDNMQRRGAAQQRGYSSLDPERSQQKESRSYETARNQEGRHGYDSQPNLQHKEGRRGRWSRDRKGEEEGDDMVHGKPKSTYQLSDWLDQKLKINQKPSTLPEPVEEDDLALRLAIAESMRMYREESQEDGIGQAEKRTASTDDDFESRDDDFRSRDDHFRSRSDHFGRRDGSKEGSWRRERNEGGHERRPNLGHHGYTRDRGYQRHEQPRRQDWQGHEERSRWQGHEENSRWQGHEENSRWQGHEEKPRWQGHEENSRWQGHEEKPRWQGHEENSRWQGHEENSRWQGHEERSRWQRHEERSRWQGHNEEKSRWQGHEEKSRWQGHNEEKSRWQGHNEEKSRWQGHNEEKSRWQGHEEKSRWQGHNEERSRWQSNPRWSNNDPYQQTERRGKVGNHGDRPTKSQTDWAKEEAGRGRGPHQQAKGHSTHGDRPTQDVKHRDDFSRTPGDVEKPTGKRAAGLKTVDQQQPPLKEEEYNWDWVNKGVPSTASRNNS